MALLTALLLGAGCTQQMAQQPAYRPYEPAEFFPDGQSARQPVANTVARGMVKEDTHLYTGKENGQDVDTFPFPVTKETIERGKERFEIYCAPCHGAVGDAQGIIVKRGFSSPPTFHDDRLRSAPVGHYYDVITNGWGSMPTYAKQIQVPDRWAIVAYIRALQLSQNARIEDVPPDQRPQLGSGGQQR